MQNITTSNSAEPFLVYDKVPTQNSILHTHHRVEHISCRTKNLSSKRNSSLTPPSDDDDDDDFTLLELVRWSQSCWCLTGYDLTFYWQ